MKKIRRTKIWGNSVSKRLRYGILGHSAIPHLKSIPLSGSFIKASSTIPQPSTQSQSANSQPFSGELTDSIGRKRCYKQGKQVECQKTDSQTQQSTKVDSEADDLQNQLDKHKEDAAGRRARFDNAKKKLVEAEAAGNETIKTPKGEIPIEKARQQVENFENLVKRDESRTENLNNQLKEANAKFNEEWGKQVEGDVEGEIPNESKISQSDDQSQSDQDEGEKKQAGEIDYSDPKLSKEWDREVNDHIDEIENGNTRTYDYKPNEIQPEKDWHKNYIDYLTENGFQGKLSPNDLNMSSRFIGGLLNPKMGEGAYVDELIKEHGDKIGHQSFRPDVGGHLTPKASRYLDEIGHKMHQEAIQTAYDHLFTIDPNNDGEVNLKRAEFLTGLYGRQVNSVLDKFSNHEEKAAAWSDRQIASRASRAVAEGDWSGDSPEAIKAREKFAKDNIKKYLGGLSEDETEDLHNEYRAWATKNGRPMSEKGFNDFVAAMIAEEAKKAQPKRTPPKVVQEQMDKDQNYKNEWLDRQRRINIQANRGAAKGRRIAAMSPEEKQARQEALQKKAKEKEERRLPKVQGSRRRMNREALARGEKPPFTAEETGETEKAVAGSRWSGGAAQKKPKAQKLSASKVKSFEVRQTGDGKWFVQDTLGVRGGGFMASEPVDSEEQAQCQADEMNSNPEWSSKAWTDEARRRALEARRRSMKPKLQSSSSPHPEAVKIASILKVGVDELPNQTTLIADNNPDITDAALAHLPNLTTLVASQNSNITDAGLVHLSNLTTLVARHNPNITDAGLAHLPNLTTLVAGHDPNITDAGLAHLPNLIMLDAGHSNITDAGLANLPNLTTLIADNNPNITDAGREFLKLPISDRIKLQHKLSSVVESVMENMPDKDKRSNYLVASSIFSGSLGSKTEKDVIKDITNIYKVKPKEATAIFGRLLGRLTTQSGVDWRPNEMIAEDYYASLDSWEGKKHSRADRCRKRLVDYRTKGEPCRQGETSAKEKPKPPEKSFYAQKALDNNGEEPDLVTSILRNLLRNHNKAFSRYKTSDLVREFRNLLQKFASYGYRVPILTDSQIAQAIESVLERAGKSNKSVFGEVDNCKSWKLEQEDDQNLRLTAEMYDGTQQVSNLKSLNWDDGKKSFKSGRFAEIPGVGKVKYDSEDHCWKNFNEKLICTVPPGDSAFGALKKRFPEAIIIEDQKAGKGLVVPRVEPASELGQDKALSWLDENRGGALVKPAAFGISIKPLRNRPSLILPKSLVERRRQI